MKNSIKMGLMFLSGVLVSGITVYAASTYLSKDVTFTPSDSSWEVSNVEEALNDLYENTGVQFDNDNVITLLDQGTSYTFTEDYDIVFSIYGTNSWINTNYTVTGLDSVIYDSRINDYYFGVEIIIYKDVKAGSSITLGGSAARALKIFAIQ